MFASSFRSATLCRTVRALFTGFNVELSIFSSSVSRSRAVRASQRTATEVKRCMFEEPRTRTFSNSCFGISYFSSIADLHVAEPAGQLVKRLPVQVGACLKIDLSKTAARVNVTVGENLEEVLLQPNWMESDARGGRWDSFHITGSDNLVHVKQSALQPRVEELPTLVEMNAQMPARWCSLDVQTSVGSVYVQNVREGSLSVTTSGGHVKLGEMKGTEASINSGGGNVEATFVQASSSVQTGGGTLSVKRLQGTSIALDSQGGHMVLGSLYGNDVTLESSGGNVVAKEIQAQERGLVSSNGGSIVINGLDGKVAVVSQGGHVQLQLNEHAEEVTVDAGKFGQVVLCLSPRLTAKLKYEGAQGVVQEGSILTSDHDFGVYEFKGLESSPVKHRTSSDWRGSENYLPGGITACEIHVSSAAKVLVKQRSWSDLVTSSFT